MIKRTLAVLLLAGFIVSSAHASQVPEGEAFHSMQREVLREAHRVALWGERAQDVLISRHEQQVIAWLPRGIPTSPGCPYPTGAVDGCFHAAAAGTYTFYQTNLLTGYAQANLSLNNSVCGTGGNPACTNIPNGPSSVVQTNPYGMGSHPPQWNIAGEYPVGLDNNVFSVAMIQNTIDTSGTLSTAVSIPNLFDWAAGCYNSSAACATPVTCTGCAGGFSGKQAFELVNTYALLGADGTAGTWTAGQPFCAFSNTINGNSHATFLGCSGTVIGTFTGTSGSFTCPGGDTCVVTTGGTIGGSMRNVTGLPAGCWYYGGSITGNSAVTNYVVCYPTATFNIQMEGYDFSLHYGVALWLKNTGSCSLSYNNVSSGIASGYFENGVSSYTHELACGGNVWTYNYSDGGGALAGCNIGLTVCGSNATNAQTFYLVNNTSYIFEYNYFKRITYRVFESATCNLNFTAKFNVFDGFGGYWSVANAIAHPDMILFSAAGCSPDDVASLTWDYNTTIAGNVNGGGFASSLLPLAEGGIRTYGPTEILNNTVLSSINVGTFTGTGSTGGITPVALSSIIPGAGNIGTPQLDDYIFFSGLNTGSATTVEIPAPSNTPPAGSTTGQYTVCTTPCTGFPAPSTPGSGALIQPMVDQTSGATFLGWYQTAVGTAATYPYYLFVLVMTNGDLIVSGDTICVSACSSGSPVTFTLTFSGGYGIFGNNGSITTSANPCGAGSSCSPGATIYALHVNSNAFSLGSVTFTSTVNVQNNYIDPTGLEVCWYISAPGNDMKFTGSTPVIANNWDLLDGSATNLAPLAGGSFALNTNYNTGNTTGANCNGQYAP